MKTNTMFLSKIPQIFSYDELLTIIKREVEVLPSIQFIMNQKDNDNNIAILKFKKERRSTKSRKKIKSTKIFNRKLNVQDYKPIIKNKNNNLYNNISSKKIQNKSDKGYIHSENEIKDKSNEIQIIKDSENESELSLLENINPNINDSKTTQSSKRKEEELVYNQFLIRDKEFKEKFEKELKKKNNKKNQEIDKIDGINNSISINQKINQNNNQPTSNNSNNLNKKVDKKPNIQKDLLYYFNQTPKNKEIYMKNIQLNLKNKNKRQRQKRVFQIN
ncbi:hypothetical protein M0812_01737 [Anaeramoeba flamelloides]|uniref:Uncharacterized protein n=1 Tax=Anaeramoeba flamelloides TaxID=1746091 RepID=A0AAV7Z4R6_9EUKA|nr:hypothetical protein M0812_01737 [Anaeramoeba flamelloides]